MSVFTENKFQNLSVREKIRRAGLSGLMVLVAQGAARVGARRIAKLHPSKPEALRLLVQLKADETVQTSADLQSEQLIKNIIERKLFPKHAVTTEESGSHEGVDFEWRFDPMDGSGSFARGHRTANVGVEVLKGEEPYIAAICNPFERELFLAEKGKGHFCFS